MKKICKIISLVFLTIIISGCSNDYKKLAYTTYNEYFNNKTDYVVLDHSDNFELNIVRNLEAGNGKIQFIYMEFSDDELAKKYIKDNYNKAEYKVKENGKYTKIKNTKNRYFKLYRVDNVILYADSDDKKNKGEINSILKDLGY